MSFRSKIADAVREWRDLHDGAPCPPDIRELLVEEVRKEQPPKSCGFATMNPERRAEIAAKGGAAAHAKGTAYQFDSDAARAAGHKGGRASWERGNAHRFTSDEARSAGLIGATRKREEKIAESA